MFFGRRKSQTEKEKNQTNSRNTNTTKNPFHPVGVGGPQIQKAPLNQNPTSSQPQQINSQVLNQKGNTTQNNNQDFFKQSIIPPPETPVEGPSQTNNGPKNQNLSSSGLEINKTPEAKVIDYNKVKEKSKLFDKFKKEAEMQETPTLPPNPIEKTAYQNQPNTPEQNINQSPPSDYDAFSNLKSETENINNEEYEISEAEESKEHFISLEDYKQSLKEFNNIRRALSNSSSVIDELKEGIEKEDDKLKELKGKLEDLERKIVLIDKLLSGGEENERE